MEDAKLMSIIFRKAESTNSEDVELYVCLEKQGSSESYRAITDEKEAREMPLDEDVYFILQQGRVIGSTSYSINGKEGYFGGLFILPEYRGQGITHEAVRFRMDRMKDCRYLWLVTHPHNSKILAMYTSMGFIIEKWIDNFEDSGTPRLKLSWKTNSNVRKSEAATAVNPHYQICW